MKITTGGTGMVSSQSSMAAATLGAGGLGYTYTWALDCSIAEPFNVGTVPWHNKTSNYNVTQVSGTDGGWKFEQNGTTLDAAQSGVILGVLNDDGITAGATYVGTDGIPEGVVSTTNKYWTIIMTLHSHTGLSVSDVMTASPNGFSIVNMPRLIDEAGTPQIHFDVGQRPPSHINGVEISTSSGTVLDASRSAVHGMLLDGSEIGSKLSITFDLSRDPDLTDTFDTNLMYWYFFNTGNGNGVVTGFNFTIHGMIIGPDPVPDLTGKSIEVNNPIPV